MRPPHTNPQRLRFVGVFLAVLSIFCVLTELAGAQTETVLYTFTGLGDGGIPAGGPFKPGVGLSGPVLRSQDGPPPLPPRIFSTALLTNFPPSCDI